MRTVPVLVLAAGLAACTSRTPGPGGEPLPEPAATAELRDAVGKHVGLATFSDSDTGTVLAVSVAGISPGDHGMHIHQTGECAAPAFTSAGPHFNPRGRQHGRENPEGPHVGDLPNLRAGADGAADTTFLLDPDLLRPGELSIAGPPSTSLVIHAQPDDQRTDPSGNSGDRIVCGVIRGE